MKRYYIVIIILVIIILALSGALGGTIFYNKKNILKLTTQNDKLLNDISNDLVKRDQEIKYLKDHPITKTEYITKEKIIKLTEPEKISKIQELQNENIFLLDRIDELNAIIASDTVAINDLMSQLGKTNEALKKVKYPSWGLGIRTVAGLDAKLRIDTYGIITVRKYFLNGKLWLDFGAGIKFYDTWGGALELGLGFSI